MSFRKNGSCITIRLLKSYFPCSKNAMQDNISKTTSSNYSKSEHRYKVNLHTTFLILLTTIFWFGNPKPDAWRSHRNVRLKIHDKAYTLKDYQNFHGQACIISPIPLQPQNHLQSPKSEEKKENKGEFKKLVPSTSCGLFV